MGISFSCRNIMDTSNGAREYLVFYRPAGGPSRALGVAHKDRAQCWVANLENARGAKIYFSAEKFSELKTQVRAHALRNIF